MSYGFWIQEWKNYSLPYQPWSCEKRRVPNSLSLLMAPWDLRLRKRETGQILREPCQNAVLATQLWCSASVVGNTSLCWGADLVVHVGSSVTHQFLFPLPIWSSYTEELLVPLEMSCCASPLENTPPPGEEAGVKPLFFGLNIVWFISEEVVAFHCAKCLFLESTQAQSHSTHSHITRGKPFIHFICFFPWESSPNAWSVIRKSKRNSDSSCFVNCQMNPFPTLASDIFRYGFNEIALTYLWPNKRKKRYPVKDVFRSWNVLIMVS